MKGSVFIPRSILEEDIFKQADLFRLWSYLRLMANHKERKAINGTQIVNVLRGQFLTSRKALSTRLNYSEGKIERMLKLLEKLGEIVQQTTSRYRLISIINYDLETKNKQQIDRKTATTSQVAQQQIDTNNNDYNKNNEYIYIQKIDLNSFSKQTRDHIKAKYDLLDANLEKILLEFINYNCGLHGQNTAKKTSEWESWFVNFVNKFCNDKRNLKALDKELTKYPEAENLNSTEQRLKKAFNLLWNERARGIPLPHHERHLPVEIQQQLNFTIDPTKKFSEILEEYRNRAL